MIAALDRATSAQMRALLHVPDFQALESAWRALFFLVRRVGTDERLKLYLLDISKAELAADLIGAEDLRSTGTYKLLVEQTVGTLGAEPWTALAGNYTFEPTLPDVELLGRLGKLGRAAGAPFLAAASSRLLGCESLAETPHPRDWKLPADSEGAQAWNSLRRLPEASYVGLALPRFLLRLPYGKDTDPIELLDFKEMSQPPVTKITSGEVQPSPVRCCWHRPLASTVGRCGRAFMQRSTACRSTLTKRMASRN